jgi:hypothetical protein
VAKETIEQLAAELTELLKDVDAAIAARMRDPRRRAAGRRREDTAGERKLPGMVGAALRWLRRAPSPQERPRKHA